jgi:hypothetical protein
MAGATNGSAGAASALNVSDKWVHKGALAWQLGSNKKWVQGTGTLDKNGVLTFHNDAGIKMPAMDARNCTVGPPKKKRKGHTFAIRLDLCNGTKYILAPMFDSEYKKWMSCLKLWSNKGGKQLSICGVQNVMSELLVNKDGGHRIEATSNIVKELSETERRKQKFPFWNCFTSEGFPIWYKLAKLVKSLEKALETMNFTSVDAFDFSDESSLEVNITHIRTGTPETLTFSNSAHFGLHTCTGNDGTKYFICQIGAESSFPEQPLAVSNRRRMCLQRCLETHTLEPLREECSDEEDGDCSDDEMSNAGEDLSSPSSDDESFPRDWEILTDKESGAQYYWNEDTREIRWVKL